MEKVLITNKSDGTLIPAVYFEAHQRKKMMRAYVLCHGLTSDKYEYLDFYKTLGEILSKEGHHVLAFDARAHGESTAPSQEFTISHMISDATSCVEWIQDNVAGIDELVVFGGSFGAVPAIMVASLLPDTVKKVFLLCPVLDFKALYLEPQLECRAHYAGLVEQTCGANKPFKITERLSFHKELVREFMAISLPEIVYALPMTVEIMHGTHDLSVPYALSESVVHNGDGLVLHRFEGMEHGFTDSGDMTGTSPATYANIQRIVQIILQ